MLALDVWVSLSYLTALPEFFTPALQENPGRLLQKAFFQQGAHTVLKSVPKWRFSWLLDRWREDIWISWYLWIVSDSIDHWFMCWKRSRLVIAREYQSSNMISFSRLKLMHLILAFLSKPFDYFSDQWRCLTFFLVHSFGDSKFLSALRSVWKVKVYEVFDTCKHLLSWGINRELMWRKPLRS